MKKAATVIIRLVITMCLVVAGLETPHDTGPRPGTAGVGVYYPGLGCVKSPSVLNNYESRMLSSARSK